MASSLDPKLVEFINYYKKKLDVGKPDNNEAVRVLSKLKKVRMTPDYLKHTGVDKSIRPYLEWAGEVGDLAKTLEADWSKGGYKSGKKPESSDKSHSSRKNHHSSISSSKCNNLEQERGKRKPESEEICSSSTNNKKIKVEVKIAKDVPRIQPDDCDRLFDSPALIKTVSNIKPSTKSEKCLNGEKQSEKKISGHKTSKSPKQSHSSTSGGVKSSKTDTPKNGDLGKSRELTGVMFLNSSKSLEARPFELNVESHISIKTENVKKSKNVSTKKAKKLSTAATEEGFDARIATFEDCLGIPDYTRSVKKKKPNSFVSNEKPAPKTKTCASSDGNTAKTSKRLSPPVTKPDISTSPFSRDAMVTTTLPEIQPNYKPMRFSIMPDLPCMRPKTKHADVNDGSFLSSRHNRTQIFSGRRLALTDVPRLFDMCMKILQENINDMQYTGGVPFDILEPVYEKCTPPQLYRMENYNPHILDDTGPLWEKHCEREFKNHKREELETWRDLYLRLVAEREEKLLRITANISATVAKTLPVRKTKLAFLDCAVKPPRNIARQQVKLGIIHEPSRPVTTKSTSSLKQQLVKPPVGSENIPTVPDIGASTSGTSHQKPAIKKVAPLMQKTIKFMKNRFRR